MLCCFCGKDVGEWCNNPYPFFAKNKNARCCDDCNMRTVVPARIMKLDEETAQKMIEESLK